MSIIEAMVLPIETFGRRAQDEVKDTMKIARALLRCSITTMCPKQRCVRRNRVDQRKFPRSSEIQVKLTRKVACCAKSLQLLLALLRCTKIKKSIALFGLPLEFRRFEDFFYVRLLQSKESVNGSYKSSSAVPGWVWQATHLSCWMPGRIVAAMSNALSLPLAASA